MKKILMLVAIVFSFSLAQSPSNKISQDLLHRFNSSSSNEIYRVWVFFKDKGNQIENCLSNPLSIVSEKSIKRRMKLNKESLLDFSDLPVYQNYIEQVKGTGFQLRNKSKWFNAISGFATKEQIVRISMFDFVKQIDLVKGYSTTKPNFEKENSFQIENKTRQPEKLYSLDYGNSFTQNNLINVPAVHNLGFDGSGVTICVMDAGFNNLAHVVFDSMNIIATWDFVNGDPNVGDENDMGSGSHGTYVLSVLGGYAHGNLIGPAYRANYILAKTENTESETPVEEDNWVAALEWADSIGVDITSTSLGYLDYDSPFIGYTWQDMDGNTALITRAADLAVKKGIVVVNSAGNEGSRGTPNTLVAPADGDSVFAIGGVDASGLRVSFSSYGPTVDGRIKPDFMAMGTGVVSARAFNQIQYTTVSGTSFSCPLTSGAIALLLQANPNLTPIQLRNILRQTSSKSSNPDNFYGWGIINTLSALNQVVGVDDNIVTSDFKLFQNYPNPFNPATKISWHSPVSGWQTLKVYDILGKEVATLVDEFREAGYHEVLVSSKQLAVGNSIASGIYFYKLQVDEFLQTKKMILMK
jgi:hypothetical protein